jgi:hypothetical protein
VLSLAEWTPDRVARVEDLRAAAGLVAREARPGDGIAYIPAWTRVGVDYHLQRAGTGRAPADLALARSADETGDLYAEEEDAATVARRLARFRRVWIASYPGSTWHPTPEPMLEAGTDVLARDFRMIEARRFGQVEIALYEQRRATSTSTKSPSSPGAGSWSQTSHNRRRAGSTSAGYTA